MNTNRIGCCWVLLLLSAPILPTKSVSGDEADRLSAVLSGTHRVVLKKYCFECHDSETKEGRLDLEALPLEISNDIKTAEWWSKILAALNAGEMPPADAAQIQAAEKTALLADLSMQMVKARNILSDSGGEITMRRLNRREYQNTLNVLLGFPPDVSTLPDDDDTGGFDTSGASLFLSSDQFEQYRATATKALQYVIRERPWPKPRTNRYQAEVKSKEVVELSKIKAEQLIQARAYAAQRDKPASEFGFKDHAQAKKKLTSLPDFAKPFEYYYSSRPENQTGTVLVPGGHNIFKGVFALKGKPAFPGGRYKIRIRAAAYNETCAKDRYIDVSFSSGKQFFASSSDVVKVSAPLDDPEIVALELDVPVDVKGVFNFRQRSYDRSQRVFIHEQWKEKNGVGWPPSIWVDWCEIEGPFFEDRLTRIPQLLESCRSDSDEEYARSALIQFATDAFRKKVPDEEYLEGLVQFYLSERKRGVESRSAMIDTLALVLSSPSFLYLIEPAAPAAAPDKSDSKTSVVSRELSPRELAIRLSYFLWSAPPDEKLMAAATNGRLETPEGLKFQTQRLLADARANEFISGFVHQWLDMKRLDTFDFESKFHPEFDDDVRRNARHEVYQTLRYIIDQKLPVETLLKTDFVVINDVLGDFYGIPNVNGMEFRKVALPANSNRGGLLGMAAIHIMGSDGQRSSPVERGAWVLRHLLNDPPPPAPANVPMLEQKDQVLSVRDLQKQHQEQPQCAQCHQKIDPIGYGLENFTATGLWREAEKVYVPEPGTKARDKKHSVPNFKTFPIDANGTLPRGESFADYFELRDQIYKEYRGDFARGIAEHLIAYGLGRSFSISDYNLATSITSQAAERGNSFSAFVQAFVRSKAFRKK